MVTTMTMGIVATMEIRAIDITGTVRTTATRVAAIIVDQTTMVAIGTLRTMTKCPQETTNTADVTRTDNQRPETSFASPPRLMVAQPVIKRQAM
jgi:hypothetical protein